jgi:hypothetical protein
MPDHNRTLEVKYTVLEVLLITISRTILIVSKQFAYTQRTDTEFWQL